MWKLEESICANSSDSSPSCSTDQNFGRKHVFQNFSTANSESKNFHKQVVLWNNSILQKKIKIWNVKLCENLCKLYEILLTACSWSMNIKWTFCRHCVFFRIWRIWCQTVKKFKSTKCLILNKKGRNLFQNRIIKEDGVSAICYVRSAESPIFHSRRFVSALLCLYNIPFYDMDQDIDSEYNLAWDAKWISDAN